MSMSKMMAMSLGLALMTGPTMAAAEWPSFTDRVQESQGIGQMHESRGEQGYTSQEYAASESVAPTGTGSFTDRVLASQFPERAPQAREEYRSVAIPSEATSFTSRVQMSQGIGQAGAEEGAAGGEPSTR